MGSTRDIFGRGRNRHNLAVALVVGALGVTTIAAVDTVTVERVEAVWTIDGEVGELSQGIPIRAAHPDCPSWSDLGGLVVTAVETDVAVTVTATFPKHDSDRPCEWMGNPMSATAKLDAPLGNRALLDGATGQDPATPAALAFRTGQSPRD